MSVVTLHVDRNWLPGGGAGVDMFFAISGYLITRLLREELSEAGGIGFGNFYMRRVLRLAPAFAALLVTILLYSALVGETHNFVLPLLAAAFYMMNWFRVLEMGAQGWVGHTWSLSVEEQFYAIWPLFLQFLGRRRLPAKILVMIAAIWLWRLALLAHGASFARVYYGFDTHADSLMIGCAAGAATLPEAVNRFATRFSWLPVAAMSLLLVGLDAESPLSLTIGYPLAAGLAAWLIVAAQQDGWLERALSLRGLRYTGRISYGWYLWHYPLLLFGSVYAPHAPRLIFAAAAFVIAAASHRWIETPFLKLKGAFTRPTPERMTSGFAGPKTAPT